MIQPQFYLWKQRSIFILVMNDTEGMEDEDDDEVEEEDDDEDEEEEPAPKKKAKQWTLSYSFMNPKSCLIDPIWFYQNEYVHFYFYT